MSKRAARPSASVHAGFTDVDHKWSIDSNEDQSFRSFCLGCSPLGEPPAQFVESTIVTVVRQDDRTYRIGVAGSQLLVAVDDHGAKVRAVRGEHALCDAMPPILMLLNCPSCGERHIDEGEAATSAHKTHACQSCGMTWQPSLFATQGVQFLPGMKIEQVKR